MKMVLEVCMKARRISWFALRPWFLALYSRNLMRDSFSRGFSIEKGINLRLNQLQEPKKKKVGKQDIDVAKQDDKKMATVPSTGKQPPADGQVAEKDARPWNKRKRETAELLQLAEKLQAKPARTGMKSNRKKYEFLNVVSCVDFVSN